MRFKVRKYTQVIERNIYGKPAKVEVYYCIDMDKFFFFKSKSLRFCVKVLEADKSLGTAILESSRVIVNLENNGYGSEFRTKEDAQKVLADFKKSPYRYISGWRYNESLRWRFLHG